MMTARLLLLAVAAAITPLAPATGTSSSAEPDYPTAAKAVYRQAIADRLLCDQPRGSKTPAPGCCRGGCAVRVRTSNPTLVVLYITLAP